MRFVRIASFRILVLGVALAGIATAPASAGSNFAQTKLEAFVTAVMVVVELVQKWTPRIRGAGSETDPRRAWRAIRTGVLEPAAGCGMALPAQRQG